MRLEGSRRHRQLQLRCHPIRTSPCGRSEYLQSQKRPSASDETTVQATFQGVDRNIWNPGTISRRNFLGLFGGGLTATALLSSCIQNNGSVEELRTASKWFSDQTIVSGQGPQRTVWSFSDEQGNLGGLSPETIQVEVANAQLDVVYRAETQRHTDGVAMPYYPVIVPFQAAEVHEFRFNLGSRGQYVGYAIPGSRSTSPIFWPGDRFPTIQSPTFKNQGSVSPICTRTPMCPFHEISIADSIASPRATIVIVTTPAFCGTSWMCGPVLENLIDNVEQTNRSFDVIHIEVYQNPTSSELGPLSPAVQEMGVNYEPFIFLIDEEGFVLRRLDHIWDNKELKALLSLI